MKKLIFVVLIMMCAVITQAQWFGTTTVTPWDSVSILAKINAKADSSSHYAKTNTENHFVRKVTIDSLETPNALDATDFTGKYLFSNGTSFVPASRFDILGYDEALITCYFGDDSNIHISAVIQNNLGIPNDSIVFLKTGSTGMYRIQLRSYKTIWYPTYSQVYFSLVLEKPIVAMYDNAYNVCLYRRTDYFFPWTNFTEINYMFPVEEYIVCGDVVENLPPAWGYNMDSGADYSFPIHIKVYKK